LRLFFGKRKDEVFKQLKTFNIAGYYTNDWGLRAPFGRSHTSGWQAEHPEIFIFG